MNQAKISHGQEENNRISIVLRNYRKAKGYSQKQLSELTGIPFQIISRYENGQEEPTPEKISILYKVLDISEEKLEQIGTEINRLFEEYIDDFFYGGEKESILIKVVKKNEHEFNQHYLNYKILLIKLDVTLSNDNIEDKEKIIHQINKNTYMDNRSKQFYFDLIGYDLLRNKKTEEGIKYLNQAKALYFDEKMIAMINYHLCFALNFQCIRETNQKVLLDSMKVFEEHHVYRRVADCLMIQGNYLSAKRYFNDAINSYKEAGKIYKTMKEEDKNLASIYRCISSVYMDNRNFEKSLEFLKLALSISNIENRDYLFYIINYYKLGNINEANRWFVKLNRLELDKELRMLAKLFDMLLTQYGKKPNDKVIEQALKIVNYYDSKDCTDLTIFYLDVLVDLYEQIEDYKNAYFYQKRKVFLLENL